MNEIRGGGEEKGTVKLKFSLLENQLDLKVKFGM